MSYIDKIKKGNDIYDIHAEEQQVKELIKADKDIISQIEVIYDEQSDETRFTFPAHIYPICFFEGNDGVNLYFDYEEKILVDEDGVENADIGYDNEGKINFIWEGQQTIDLIDELFYLNSSIYADDLQFNWLNILKPQPAGTKLYRHYIVIDDNDDECFDIITNLSIIFPSNASLIEKLTFLADYQANYLYSSTYSISQGDTHLFNGVFYNVGEDAIEYSGFDQDDGTINHFTWSNITSITDTVTEL